MRARHWTLYSFLIVSLASAAFAQSPGGDLWLSARRTPVPAIPVAPGLPPGVFSASDNGYVGVYADMAGTEPCIQLPGIGTFYIIATTGGGTSSGLTGAEFRIEAINATGYFWIATPNPNAAVSIGDPFGAGANIAFSTCQGSMPGDKILLYTVTSIPTAGGPVDFLVKRRNPPPNPDFACPLFTLCDPPNFTKVCMLTCPDGDPDPIAFKAQLNVAQCSDLGPCPSTPCPDACVQMDLRLPEFVCEGEPLVTTTVATNCATDPESIYVHVNGQLAGAFGDVPPGGEVIAEQTLLGTQCMGGFVPVQFIVRGVIPGCPAATIMQNAQVPCRPGPCGGPGPDCSNAAATLTELWPANHKLVTVGITGVTTSDGMAATIEITGVTSDEIVNGWGDGDTCPDAIIGGSTVQLRAERSGTGNGRVYTLHFTATDVAGNVCSGTATACVPHDRGAGSVCVDDGGAFDATTCETSAPMAPRRGLQMARDARAGIGLTFALDQAGPVELIVFDIAGHALRTLVSGSYPEGVHTVHWNGLDATGRPVANGVYFFRLKAGGESQTVKGVWVR